VMAVRGQVGLPHRRDVPRVLALGLLGNVAYQMCFILGLSRTQAGHASLILALTPVTIALLSTLTGHERPGPRTWGGALLSVLGVGLVTGAGLRVQGANALLGNLILLGACLTWAFYTVGARPIVERYGSLQATAWTMWVGTVGLIVAGAPALVRQRWSQVSTAAWGGLGYSALFAIGLAYLIWYRGVERIGNTRTAIFSNLTPVVAMAAAALILAERPGLGSLLGAALTLGGVAIVHSDPRGT
jgi:drug/metabolite transporter (DMT)-like permease